MYLLYTTAAATGCLLLLQKLQAAALAHSIPYRLHLLSKLIALKNVRLFLKHTNIIDGFEPFFCLLMDYFTVVSGCLEKLTILNLLSYNA